MALRAHDLPPMPGPMHWIHFQVQCRCWLMKFIRAKPELRLMLKLMLLRPQIHKL